MEDVGRFRVVRALGSGGFGTVYEGMDRQSGETVAIKLMDKMGGPPELVRSQLLAEADALRSVSSPHTLRVLDVIDDGAVLALVTDLLPGATLRVMLDEHGPLDGRDALVVLRGAAMGLAAVHAAGLVHGDVKPANILVEPDGTSRLIDFGLASLPGWVSADAVSPWGSPAYAPPEQVRDEYRDARSDIYSLTVTLFEALCGQRPFAGDTADEVRANHVHQPMPDPRLFVPDLGDGLTQVLLWGLAKSPQDRPPDVDTWLAYLDEAAEAKHGSGWAAAAGVGSIAGALIAGGVVASGVLAPVAAGPAVSAAAGSAAAGSAGVAGSGAAASGGTATTGVAGAGGAGAATGAGAGGAAATAGGGFLSTIGGKIAVGLTAACLVGGGATYAGTQLLGESDTPPAPVSQVTPAAGPVEKIAFHRCDPLECEIVMIDPDGTNEVPLVEGRNPAWSSNGARLAYDWPSDSGSELRVVEVTAGEVSGDPTSVHPGQDWTVYTDVTWSPDGETLGAFHSGGTVGSEYGVVVPASGGAPESFSDFARPPSWSPDGSEVVGVSMPEGYQGLETRRVIARASADGTSPVEIGEFAGAWYGNPVWAPSGDLIAYPDATEEGVSIWLMGTDGEDKRRLTDGDAPAWSPDGSSIAFERCPQDSEGLDGAEACALHTIDIASGDEIEIGIGKAPSWTAVPADADVKDDEPTEPVTFDPVVELDGEGNVVSGDQSAFDDLPGGLKAFLRDYAVSEHGRCGGAQPGPAVDVVAWHPDGFVKGGSRYGPPCGPGAELVFAGSEAVWAEVLSLQGVPGCAELQTLEIPTSFFSTCFTDDGAEVENVGG